MPTFGGAAEHQHSAGRQQSRRDDVVGHRAHVVEQCAERENRQRGHRRNGNPFESRSVALFVQPPEALCFRGETFERPVGTELRGVVLADRLPRVVAAHASLVRHADVVSDRGARPMEAGPIVRTAFADRRRQDISDRRFVRRVAWLGSDPGKRQHVGDELGEVTQMDFDPRAVAADVDQPLAPPCDKPNRPGGLAGEPIGNACRRRP